MNKQLVCELSFFVIKIMNKRFDSKKSSFACSIMNKQVCIQVEILTMPAPKEKYIPNVNPVKPPVLSESKPLAKDEVSTAARLNGARACLQWYIYS